jgi:peptidase E
MERIYLEGGGDIRKEENDDLDSRALSESKNKKVYVIDLTSNDEEKVAQYREPLEKYFKRLGAEEVGFVSTSESLSEIKEKLEEAGVIYIPGGDTATLIDNLKKKQIGELLINLESIIIGNSAGAMVLSREAICAYEGREIMEGLNIADINIDVHYDNTHDKILNNLSKDRDMYGIAEKGAIIWEDGNLKFIGDIYLFSQGKKEKIN